MVSFVNLDSLTLTVASGHMKLAINSLSLPRVSPVHSHERGDVGRND